MKKSLQREVPTEQGQTQVIRIYEDGDVLVDWITPDCSSVVRAVMDKKDKERIKSGDKIWCG